MSESDPQPLFNYLVEQLNAYNLAYLHVVENFAESDDGFDFGQLRDKFNAAYMANGGYNAGSAEKSLVDGRSDFVSFGSDFIANPDLPERIKQGIALSEPDSCSFYGGHSEGYTDYPTMSA